MVPKSTRPKLLVIVGPTASGKSDLAMKIAQEFDGEIICADSRTVYKGMDIGKAKPTRADQGAVPHWGLDLIEPGQRFSAARFKRYAQPKIKQIRTGGKLPILVGGSGLYVDSLIFDYAFATRIIPVAGLNNLSVAELQRIIKEKKYPMPENFKNKRHLINTIRRKGQTGTRKAKPTKAILLVGLLPPDEVLRQRINARAERIFKAGVVEESRELLEKYGQQSLEKTSGIVYKICLDVLAGKISQAQALEKFKKADWQYARRQKTWFKRNKFIHWFDSNDRAYNFVRSNLAKNR